MINLRLSVDANIRESSTAQGAITDGYGQTSSFYRLWGDGFHELYSGFKKFIQIAFILKMLHIKPFCNMSNKVFDIMIDLTKTILPNGETVDIRNQQSNTYLVPVFQLDWMVLTTFPYPSLPQCSPQLFFIFYKFVPSFVVEYPTMIIEWHLYFIAFSSSW